MRLDKLNTSIHFKSFSLPPFAELTFYSLKLTLRCKCKLKKILLFIFNLQNIKSPRT